MFALNYSHDVIDTGCKSANFADASQDAILTLAELEEEKVTSKWIVESMNPKRVERNIYLRSSKVVCVIRQRHFPEMLDNPS